MKEVFTATHVANCWLGDGNSRADSPKLTVV